MFKKSLLCAFLATIFIGSANTADASLILVLWEAGGPEAVVIDNKFAGDTVGGWTATVDDANMTLGAAVYNQSFGSYSVANITAESKPALPGNEMDLGGVVSTGKTILQTCLQFLSTQTFQDPATSLSHKRAARTKEISKAAVG